MNDETPQVRYSRARATAYLIGVPVITTIYTGCLILVRASDWQAAPRSLGDHTLQVLMTVFFKPAYHLSLLLPRVAGWRHALGIVLIMGVLWGIVLVSLGVGIAQVVRKRKGITLSAS